MTPYCDRADIEVIFGKLNVQRWADLDNDESELMIPQVIGLHDRILKIVHKKTEWLNSVNG